MVIILRKEALMAITRGLAIRRNKTSLHQWAIKDMYKPETLKVGEYHRHWTKKPG